MTNDPRHPPAPRRSGVAVLRQIAGSRRSARLPADAPARGLRQLTCPLLRVEDIEAVLRRRPLPYGEAVFGADAAQPGIGLEHTR
jgi:hypothetical protein